MGSVWHIVKALWLWGPFEESIIIVNDPGCSIRPFIRFNVSVLIKSGCCKYPTIIFNVGTRLPSIKDIKAKESSFVSVNGFEVTNSPIWVVEVEPLLGWYVCLKESVSVLGLIELSFEWLGSVELNRIIELVFIFGVENLIFSVKVPPFTINSTEVEDVFYACAFAIVDNWSVGPAFVSRCAGAPSVFDVPSLESSICIKFGLKITNLSCGVIVVEPRIVLLICLDQWIIIFKIECSWEVSGSVGVEMKGRGLSKQRIIVIDLPYITFRSDVGN